MLEMKSLEKDKKDKKIKGFKGIKKIPGILAILGVLVIPISCDKWLDVVPENMPAIDDAFSNRATAEKSLFTCYSYLPDAVDPYWYPTYYTHRSEVDYTGNAGPATTIAGRISRGDQNSNSPLLDYWSGRNGGSSMFQAIRFCNIFLEEIYKPRDISENERKRWIAEVKFLKAYYHFFLLQLYGPIPIVKENIPLSASPEEAMLFREPVDECIAYIAQLINEAVPDLPLYINNNIEEDGRITQPIALAVKARALTWGASPLFNGNQYYQNWKDSRGKLLVSDVYSKEKWEKAATALRNAIDTCHLAGHQLYQYNKLLNASTVALNDSLVWLMNTRKAITERWNKGIIWSCMNNFGSRVSFPSAATRQYADMQRILFPRMYQQDATKDVNLCYAQFAMAELFYSNNGIPIDEDNHWNYAARYQLQTSTEEAGHKSYLALGEQTVALHFNREPRFYANLGFDRGFFEISTSTINGGASFSPYQRMRFGEVGNYVYQTGYHVKKLVAFETSCSQGNDARGYNPYLYRFPLIRLADLYLMYSEALNEVKSAPDADVYFWIDSVRAVVGLDGVVDSWKNSRYPNRPRDKDEMRKIIQRERLIELSFEGQRFWDVRRWKLAETLFTYSSQGWNTAGETAEQYYTIIDWNEGRKFALNEYLWPINLYDLRVNRNLVQTYGW